MERGDWIPNGTKLLIISIYAPQDISEKKMLWDYLSHVIAQWAGEFPKGNNSSFIALIPKTRDANMVKDFRPISLIGSMYKIIAKILANRLVLVLGDLVNEVQSAFIADRQILDGPFILNEIVQWCKSKKKRSLVRFGKKCALLIKVVLRSSRGSVIVNGESYGRISILSKGLEQGGSFISFLFILVMETLHISFQRIIDARMFKGLRLNSGLKEKGGLEISSSYALNRALMFKWVWRFLSQNSLLRANVIKSIHGDHEKIGKQVKVSYPSIWLDIVKEVDLLKKQGLNLLSFVNKKVGNGSDTLFREETWHGDVVFKFLFPRAYALESCKNNDVASKLSQNSLAFTFRREPRGGVEQDQFDSLKAMVEGTSLVNIRDR
ncbi:hypothetical protein Tco_1546537 [Tanacetum coccineum]